VCQPRVGEGEVEEARRGRTAARRGVRHDCVQPRASIESIQRSRRPRARRRVTVTTSFSAFDFLRGQSLLSHACNADPHSARPRLHRHRCGGQRVQAGA
jgi:hypothetical protein